MEAFHRDSVGPYATSLLDGLCFVRQGCVIKRQPILKCEEIRFSNMKSRHSCLILMVLFIFTPVSDAADGTKNPSVAEASERLKQVLSAPPSASAVLEESGAKRYRSLLDPTFHLNLDFDSARRLIISPGGGNPNLAVFMFLAPSSLEAQFRSFGHLSVDGVLASKVHTHYTVLSKKGILCIVLSEQKPVPPDSPVISAIYQSLSAEP